MKIILDLTKAQAEKLDDVLISYWDRGPWGEGWQSEELIELQKIVEKALKHPQDTDLMQQVVGFLRWVYNDATRRSEPYYMAYSDDTVVAPFYIPHSGDSIVSDEQETLNMAQDAKKLISDIEKTFDLGDKREDE